MANLTLPRVTKFVKVLILVTFGLNGAPVYQNEPLPTFCQHSRCDTWCKFYHFEPGTPQLASPPAETVFCSPEWDPRTRPLRYLPEAGGPERE